MSDHWYSRAGQPAYEQITAKGGLRATDLRDARKLGLVPSVTTVLSVVAKPQLEKWKRDQVLMAALTLPRTEAESEADFLRRIAVDSEAQAKAAAEEGTRIHDAIEAYFKEGCPSSSPYIQHVRAVRAELSRLFPDVTDWVPEKSFASEEGFGGKVDLHSPSTGIVCDWKGKDGDFSDGKKLAYDQHWQLAPYQRGLRLKTAPCANLFVSRTHPGKVAAHVWTPQDIAEGWEVFAAALSLWKAIKRYDPAFASEARAA
jgi:hypothetical protein